MVGSLSQLASLDFVINPFFIKLFNTNNMKTVKDYQEYFSFELPSIQLGKCIEDLKQDLWPMEFHTLCDVVY